MQTTVIHEGQTNIERTNDFTGTTKYSTTILTQLETFGDIRRAANISSLI